MHRHYYYIIDARHFICLIGVKKGTVPAGKNAKAPPPKQEPPKPEVPKWTPQDEAARKIQITIRGFLARRRLEKLKKEKEEYLALMDKLEKEVSG